MVYINLIKKEKERIEMTKKNPWFTDKYFIITGGSSGIGLALSKEFLLNGARVIIVSYDPNEFEAARTELETLPDIEEKIEFYKCDITKAEDRMALKEELLKRNFDIAGLVNNAGITTYGPFFETPSKDIERLMQINFVGSIMFTKDLFPLCLTQECLEEGQLKYIVFMSSTSGIVPFPFIGGYSGTKRGVEFFLESLSHELPKNVKILRMRPGTVYTNLYKNALQADCADINDLLQTTENMKVNITADKVAKPLVKAIIKKKSGRMYPNLTTRLFYGMLAMPFLGKRMMKYATKKMESGFEKKSDIKSEI
ncbi:MAG: SDR family NAD(P)-dependent oxidoreductase [Candidatus Lokiarchaeota archaeon]|nr:SDR family NAD(P)-dependent oxidoreductase [Candidatus Lokiarchaeota archaeon]